MDGDRHFTLNFSLTGILVGALHIDAILLCLLPVFPAFFPASVDVFWISSDDVHLELFSFPWPSWLSLVALFVDFLL